MKLYPYNARLIAVFNMGLRAVALASRFILTFYIARYLGLSDVGAFGLLAGAVAIVPPIIGFGLTYRISREIVGLPIEESSLKVRERFLFTAAVLSVLLAMYILLINITNIGEATSSPYFIAILVLETLCFEAHYALISLRRTVLANLIIFIRTSSWVVPFVLCGVYSPNFRNFDWLLRFWFLALVVAFAYLFWVLRKWPWRFIMSKPIKLQWLYQHFRRAHFIHLSDIGIVGASFSDRFIIGFSLGLKETGIFVFFWSLANGVQVLVNTGIIQPHLPDLVESARLPDLSGFRQRLRKQLTMVFFTACAFCCITGGAYFLIVPYLKRPELSDHIFLFASLLLTIVLRSCSEVLKGGLYARHMDSQWALTNFIGLVVNSGVTVVSLTLFGLNYVGVALFVSEVIQLSMRHYLVNRTA